MANKEVESPLTCPHCGSKVSTFQNGAPAMTTEGIFLIPYWCNVCMLPWHVYKKNGKVVSRDEF